MVATLASIMVSQYWWVAPIRNCSCLLYRGVEKGGGGKRSRERWWRKEVEERGGGKRWRKEVEERWWRKEPGM